MIIYSAFGCFAMLFANPHVWSPPLPRLLYMAAYAVQIGLLVSTPMYERTRPGWIPGPSSGPWLPVPRLWLVLVSAAAGLGITLLRLGNLRPIPCPAHVKVLAHLPCLAGGTGEPFAYRWFAGYTQNLANGSTRWLNIAAPRGLQVLPFAMDWFMWCLAILLVFYCIGLNGSREPNPPLRYAPLPAPEGP
jgi:hypothetical protein